MNISEKVAYIKGLAEGLTLDESTKEGKLLAAIIDILGDVSDEIDDIEDVVSDLGDQIDAVDEDLATVEEIIYDDEDEDDEDDDDEYFEDDDDLYEVQCPECKDTIYVDSEMLEDGGIDCPNCGTRLDFDFDCDCEECNTEDAEDK